MQFQWGAGDEQHSRGQPCQFRLAGRRDEDIDTVQLLSPTRTNSLHKEMSSSRQERRQSPEASTELMAKGTGHRTDIQTQLNLIIPFQAHYMTMDTLNLPESLTAFKILNLSAYFLSTSLRPLANVPAHQYRECKACRCERQLVPLQMMCLHASTMSGYSSCSYLLAGRGLTVP